MGSHVSMYTDMHTHDLNLARERGKHTPLISGVVATSDFTKLHTLKT